MLNRSLLYIQNDLIQYREDPIIPGSFPLS